MGPIEPYLTPLDRGEDTQGVYWFTFASRSKLVSRKTLFNLSAFLTLIYLRFDF